MASVLVCGEELEGGVRPRRDGPEHPEEARGGRVANHAIRKVHEDVVADFLLLENVAGGAEHVVGHGPEETEDEEEAEANDAAAENDLPEWGGEKVGGRLACVDGTPEVRPSGESEAGDRAEERPLDRVRPEAESLLDNAAREERVREPPDNEEQEEVKFRSFLVELLALACTKLSRTSRLWAEYLLEERLCCRVGSQKESSTGC